MFVCCCLFGIWLYELIAIVYFLFVLPIICLLFVYSFVAVSCKNRAHILKSAAWNLGAAAPLSPIIGRIGLAGCPMVCLQGRVRPAMPSSSRMVKLSRRRCQQKQWRRMAGGKRPLSKR